MLKKMRPEELPRRTRKQPSSFESLPDWPKLKKALDEGLAESEAWNMFVEDDVAAEYGVAHPRTGPRFLKKYVRSLGKRYTVKRVKGYGGINFQVSNPVVLTKRRARSA